MRKQTAAERKAESAHTNALYEKALTLTGEAEAALYAAYEAWRECGVDDHSTHACENALRLLPGRRP